MNLMATRTCAIQSVKKCMLSTPSLQGSFANKRIDMVTYSQQRLCTLNHSLILSAHYSGEGSLPIWLYMLHILPFFASVLDKLILGCF